MLSVKSSINVWAGLLVLMAGTISLLSGCNNRNPKPVESASLSANNKSAASSHSVRLSWDASVPTSGLHGEAVVGYNVYRSMKPHVQCTVDNKIGSLAGPVTSYVDTHVAAGQTYYYVTTALSASGKESGCSNEVRAAIPSP